MGHHYVEDEGNERRTTRPSAKQSKSPWGWIQYNGKDVPSFEKAREATVLQVFEWLDRMETVKTVNGSNGAELKGWCPWGESHGKQGSFSINLKTGKGMCHACKRTCSHVIKFMALYIESHRDDPLFSHIKLKDDQAGAQWLVEKLSEDQEVEECANEVFAPREKDKQERRVDDTADSGIPQPDNGTIYDPDAIAYALRVLGIALQDEDALRAIAKICALVNKV